MGDTVIDRIVAHGLCIGCGVCAGMCPHQRLKIEFNESGEYVARQEKPCARPCGICLRVCPFHSENENEDSLADGLFSLVPHIQHRRETGYYLGSHFGYSLENDHRERGASGGLSTWLLENLLMQDFVDRVVCVTAQADSEKLFRFAVFDSVDLLRRASGSVYYPVELSDIVRFILDHPGRFALVGLPCFIKAIRLAQIENPLLRERLKYLLGLVCGQTKSRLYTRFISTMAGVSDPPVEVFYRKKDFRRPSHNYAFEVRSTTGRRGTLGRLDGVGRVWGSRMFTPRACNYCDDVYAELADVALMDAWLPEYENEALGANLVITRSPDLERILVEAGHANRIHLENLEITPIIKSQEGVLRVKREQLAYRLRFAQNETGVRVTKRVSTAVELDFIEKKEVRVRDRIQKKCIGEYMRLQRHGCVQPDLLFRALMPELAVLRFWERCRMYARLPRRILAKVKKIVGLKG